MGTQLARTRLAILFHPNMYQSEQLMAVPGVWTPGEVEINISGDIVSMAVGFAHAMFATTDGETFTWNRNSFGQLGLGSEGEEGVYITRKKPVRVEGALLGKKVVKVAAGSFHSFALTDEGELYGWGMDEVGQTGVSCLGSRDKPRLVSSLPKGTKIVDVAAGWNHSALVDSEGALFMWGAGKEGQTGLYSGADVSSPTRVDKLRKEKVVAVACGYSHTVVATASSTVYTFGEDGCRHMILEDSASLKSYKTLNGMGIKQMACGKEFSLFLNTEGVVFAAGANDVGQLGMGDRVRRSSPMVIRRLLYYVVVKVCAFSRYCVAFTREGLAFHWGEDILTPTLRANALGPTVDGAAGNGFLIAKARVVDALQKQVEEKKENIFGAAGGIGRDMKKLLVDPFFDQFADVSLKLDRCDVPAHSFMLRVRSDGNHHAIVKGRKEIHLPTVSRGAVRALLQFVYTSTFPQSMTLEDAYEALTVAHSLDLSVAISSLEMMLPKASAVTSEFPEPGMECSICLTEMHEDDFRRLECGHFHHDSCVGEWLMRRSQCPLCKRPVTLPNPFVMTQNTCDTLDRDGVAWRQSDGMLDTLLGIDLISALKNEMDTDIIVYRKRQYETTKIRAHRAVLAARSSAFRDMLLTQPEAKELCVDKISDHFLEAIVHFMYGGSDAITHLLPGWAKELLYTAEEFGMPDLKDLCARYLLHKLKVRDFPFLLNTATRTKATRLRMGCLSLLQNEIAAYKNVIEAHESGLLHFKNSKQDGCLLKRARQAADKQLLNKWQEIKMILNRDVLTLTDAEALRTIRVMSSFSQALRQQQEKPQISRLHEILSPTRRRSSLS